MSLSLLSSYFDLPTEGTSCGLKKIKPRVQQPPAGDDGGGRLKSGYVTDFTNSVSLLLHSQLYIHTYKHTCTRRHVYTPMYTDPYTRWHVYIQTYVHAVMYMHPCIKTHVCRPMYTLIPRSLYSSLRLCISLDVMSDVDYHKESLLTTLGSHHKTRCTSRRWYL